MHATVKLLSSVNVNTYFTIQYQTTPSYLSPQLFLPAWPRPVLTTPILSARGTFKPHVLPLVTCTPGTHPTTSASPAAYNQLPITIADVTNIAQLRILGASCSYVATTPSGGA